jgi:collagen beta-1,O-galactosyltransferase
MRTYVVNLKRRPDRLARMQAILPPELRAEYTTGWPGPVDGQSIDEASLKGYGLLPWQIESDNRFWNRPLKKGEIGCAVSHWLCWQRSLQTDDDLFLYLEDDIELADGFLPRLEDALERLSAFDPEWGLLYLGRHPQAPDEAAIEGIVRPGYSYCTFAYILTRGAVEQVLATRYNEALIPADEFLPSLYCDHPREDVRRRYPKLLSAYALEPPLVRDLPRNIWGTDTEDSDDLPD